MQQVGSCVFRFSPYKLTIVSEIVRSLKGKTGARGGPLFAHSRTQ